VNESKRNEILTAIENGRAYYIDRRNDESVYIYLPKEAYEQGILLGEIEQENKKTPFKEAMVKLFDNCTIEIADKKEYVEVTLEEIKCRRAIAFEIEKRYVIVNGKIYTGESICEQCQDYLKNLINECDSSSLFKWKKKKELKNNISDELWTFKEMKKGYLTRTNFDDEIYAFSSDKVKERIEEFEDRGRFVQDKIRTEGDVCKGCIKYKTKVCRGLSRHNIEERRDGHCNVTKEQFSEDLEKEIKNKYGSMGKALWFFSQCGQQISFRDPNTNRESLRYISIPGTDGYGGQINGFRMAFVNYPLSIDGNTHETFISEKELRAHPDFKETKTRYAKKYRDIVVAGEAYRKGKDPGDYIVTSGHTNYLAYAKIGMQSYRWAGGKEGTYFIIGAQTSSNTVYPVYVSDIRELLKETGNVKGLSSWY
jgi:hypothetical protein